MILGVGVVGSSVKLNVFNGRGSNGGGLVDWLFLLLHKLMLA